MKKKKTKKISKLKKLFKGFTLVELLAVIVVLAIIMIIAIPSVLNTMRTAKRKAFLEFAQKCITEAEKTYVKQTTFGSLIHPSERTDYIYDIRKDIGLTNPGDYYGVVKISVYTSGSVYNNIYMVDDEYSISYSQYNDKELKEDLIKDRSNLMPDLPDGVKLDDIDLKKGYALRNKTTICNLHDLSSVDPITNTEYFCQNKSNRENFLNPEECTKKVEDEINKNTIMMKYLQGELIYTCPDSD